MMHGKNKTIRSGGGRGLPIINFLLSTTLCLIKIGLTLLLLSGKLLSLILCLFPASSILYVCMYVHATNPNSKSVRTSHSTGCRSLKEQMSFTP